MERNHLFLTMLKLFSIQNETAIKEASAIGRDLVSSQCRMLGQNKSVFNLNFVLRSLFVSLSFLLRMLSYSFIALRKCSVT